MADYGLSDTGFTQKLLADVITDNKSEAVTLFQDQVAVGDVVDTSDSSILGRLINLASLPESTLWEIAQEIYTAFTVDGATGVALDNLVQFAGITRRSNSYSTAIGLFAGDNGTLINSGQTIKNPATNDLWLTVDSVALSPSQATGVSISVASVGNNTAYTVSYTNSGNTINLTYTSDSSATSTEILNGLQAVISADANLVASVSGPLLIVDKADVFSSSNFSVTGNLGITKVRKTGTLQADVVGAITAEANTINQIVTAVLGWDSVTNPLAASPGALIETDEELRLRFLTSKADRSTNLLDSLYSALVGVDGVQEVAIYENDTSVTDSNGVLGHSFLPVVLGGSSQLIAEAIWQNKPIGILSQGNTTVTITDSQGFPHDISFDRPSPVNIYISMTLTVDPAVYPGDGDEQIKEAILSYASSNIGVGDEVIWSRLFTPINSVPGHQVDSLFIGTSPSPTGTANIPVAFNEIASFTTLNISISS